MKYIPTMLAAPTLSPLAALQALEPAANFGV
jgi:hypothetical protein